MSAPNGGSQSIAPYDIDNGATSTMEPPEVQAWDVQDSGQVDADVWEGKRGNGCRSRFGGLDLVIDCCGGPCFKVKAFHAEA